MLKSWNCVDYHESRDQTRPIGKFLVTHNVYSAQEKLIFSSFGWYFSFSLFDRAIKRTGIALDLKKILKS